MTHFRFDSNQLPDRARSNSDAWNNSLIVIDKNIQDYDSLAKSISAVASFVFIEQDKSGLEQLLKILDRYTNIKQLHLFSHGNSGKLQLGNQTVDINVLNYHQDKIAKVFQKALGHDSDFLIYGCNVAKGEQGLNFINRIHQITGANIAASSTVVGSKNLGGTWDLGFRIGKISHLSKIPINWNGILPERTNGNDEIFSGSRTYVNVTENSNVLIDPMIYCHTSNSGGYRIILMRIVTLPSHGTLYLKRSKKFPPISGTTIIRTITPLSESIDWVPFTADPPLTSIEADSYNYLLFNEPINSSMLDSQAGIRYVPHLNWHGDDYFEYEAYNNKNSDYDYINRTTAPIGRISQAYIRVNPVNTAPIIDRGGVSSVGATNSYISVPSFTVGSQFSFEAWIKPTAAPSQDTTIFDFSNGMNVDNIILQYKSGKLAVYTHDGSAGTLSTTTISLALNSWSHVALTIDGTTGKLYINGALQATIATKNLRNIARSSNFIGYNSSGTGDYFKANIRDIRIWDRDITQNEIIAGMTGVYIGGRRNLLMNYRLNTGSGTTATDSSGNNRHGTLRAGLTWTDDTCSYSEGDWQVAVAPNIFIQDPDINPASATLTAQVVTNAGDNDQLEVGNQGIGSKKIQVSHLNVAYGGTTIGTITGSGVNKTSLIISFNASATIEAIQALARVILFSNNSHNPGTANRTVRFSFNDGTGAAVATYNQTLTVTASNDVPTIDRGGGVIFDGVNDFISIPSWSFWNKFTFEAWVKPDGAQPNQARIFDFGNGQNSDNIILSFLNNKLEFHGYTGTSKTFTLPTNITLIDNVWSHVAVAIGGNGLTTVYLTINGVQVYTGTGSETLNFTTSRGSNFVGKSNWSGNPYFKGAMRDIRLWNITRSTKDISENMYTSYSNYESQLICNLKLNEVSGTTATDAQGVYHGTLVNGPTWINQPIVYTENDPYAIILPNGIVGDPDSANFNGGSLTVSFSANGSATDQLKVLHQGTGAGQISASGGTVKYQNATIGTYTGGTNGSDLVISFTSTNATLTAVQALLRVITFSNTSENPSTLVRTVRFIVDDGDGGISAALTQTISVIAVNDPPEINTTNTLIYKENDPATAICPAATITDVDSPHFNGGSLNIAITANSAAEDQLSILTQGAITTTASNVRYNGTNIGTLSGVGTSNLTIAFISTLVTPAVAEELVRAIAYSNSSEYPSTAARTVTFTINDNGGGTSINSSTATINVLSVNDQPVLGSFGNTVTYTEGRTPVVINSAATLADIDMPASYENGSLTIEIQEGGVVNETISVKNLGTGVGQISIAGNDVSYQGVIIGTMSGGTGGTPCVIALNDQATLAAVQALMRNITYYSSASSDILRTALFTVVDGAGTANGGIDTATATSIIDVRAKSPPVFNATNTIHHYKGEGPELLSASATLTDSANPDYNAGTLTVSMLTGGTTADLLAIRNQGIGVGQVGVSGANVTYGGVLIGTFTGGIGSASPLAITFSVNSTPASVLAVVRNITYDSSDAVYIAETKTVKMDVVNPDSANSISIITVQLHPNTAPVLTPTPYVFPSQGSNIINDAGQYVSTILGGSLTDADDWSDLGIVISSMTITKPGMGKWQYSINNGASWSDVGIVTNFNSLALRSTDKVRFLPDGSNTNQATFTFRGWDGSSETYGTKVYAPSGGGIKAFSDLTSSASIDITGTDNAPTLTTTGAPLSYTAGAPAITVDSGITISDDNYKYAKFSVAIGSGGCFGDTLVLRNVGNGANQVGITSTNITYGGIVVGTLKMPVSFSDSLTVSFNAAATQPIVEAVAKNIMFENSSVSTLGGDRVVSFEYKDSSMQASSSTRTIAVTSPSYTVANSPYLFNNSYTYLSQLPPTSSYSYSSYTPPSYVNTNLYGSYSPYTSYSYSYTPRY